jgi:hypothetical protein
LTATANYETVSLQWNDNSEGDLAGYNIYRSTTSGTGYTKLNGPLLVTSDYTDNAVANYTSYFYVVTAVDIDANESGNSNQDSATPNHGIVTQLNMEDFELGLGAWTNIPETPMTGPETQAEHPPTIAARTGVLVAAHGMYTLKHQTLVQTMKVIRPFWKARISGAYWDAS